MRWLVIAGVFATVLGASVAFAAALNVSSARVTVFNNTLNTTTVSVTPTTLSIVVGSQAGASATLGGAVGATGTATYKLHTGAGCGTEYVPSPPLAPVTVAGSIPDSALVTFTMAGTYSWSVSYSGDGNNQPDSSTCSAALVVQKASPQIATTATGGAVGDSIFDTATLTGGYFPSGTIEFRLYGPGDTECGTELAFSSATVDGSPDYTSALFPTGTTFGTYFWVATYVGDPNNNIDIGVCGEPGESSVVT